MDYDKNITQVEIFGLTLSSSLSGGGYAVILKEIDGERRLPIVIGQFEAQVIAIHLEGVNPPRPLTHDLLKNFIELFGFSIDFVTITELRDSTFYAKIKIDNDTYEEIDARPSDAIALALKFNAPIFVANAILDEIGFIPEAADEKKKEEKDLSFEDEFDEEQDTKSVQKKLEQLKKDLDDAVTNEDYEKAATLRDEIKKIEISNLN